MEQFVAVLNDPMGMQGVVYTSALWLLFTSLYFVLPAVFDFLASIVGWGVGSILKIVLELIRAHSKLAIPEKEAHHET